MDDLGVIFILYSFFSYFSFKSSKTSSVAIGLRFKKDFLIKRLINEFTNYSDPFFPIITEFICIYLHIIIHRRRKNPSGLQN